MARQLVIAALLSGILSTALAQSSHYKSKPNQDSVTIDVGVSGNPGSEAKPTASGSVNPSLTSSNANYWQADPYNGLSTAAQFQPYVPTAPLMSFQKELYKLPPWYNYASAAVVPSSLYSYQPLTPLGALAAFKADLLPTIIVTGIIATGILLLFMLKGALVSGADALAADFDTRKKRSLEDDGILKDYEYLARLIVPALQSEQCLQNMFCQLATSSSELEQSGVSLSALLSALPTSLAPSLQVFKKILEKPGPCELYVCPIINNAKP